MNTKKVVPGAVLIVAAVAVLAYGGLVHNSVTTVQLAVAAIALAGGTLLVGTSATENRNV